MRLRIRAIQLRVKTPEGMCGADIVFQDGLVVLRAENSAGKSTVVQSVIYALGLEGMLSASQAVPLPHAMTDSIEVDDKKVLSVEESRVTVEIENGDGQIATVSRSIKGVANKNLVNVYLGSHLTSPDQGLEPTDYYVIEGGAAVSERGFHRWFAAFIGWKIPRVTRMDGSECPLYVECVFPLMIIEQKRGWSAIQARMPFHYRIRDIAKKSTEFLLALDVFETALRRQRLKEEALAIRAEWDQVAARISDVAKRINGVVQNLPEVPRHWTEEEAPTILISRNGGWVSLQDAIRADIQALTELEEREIPRVQQVAVEVETALNEAESDLAETEFATAELFNEIQSEDAQLSGIDERLISLQEDERKNVDARKLRRLGSVQQLEVDQGRCPTCHQTIADALTVEDDSEQPMTIDETLKFIRSQIETFGTIQKAAMRSVEAKKRRLGALRGHANELRANIRALRRTLVSEGSQPSVEAVERRIRLTERVNEERLTSDEVAEQFDALGDIAKRFKENQDTQDKLPKGDLSERDQQKLKRLQEIFISEVSQFGLTSVDPSTLRISEENYKPEHDGFDLEFDLSASDMVRTLWGYLHGLVELARTEQTNHLGLLILDEPKQQETKRPSFQELFHRASAAGANHQQVIIATSEEEQTLLPLLDGVSHQYIRFEGRILRPLNAPPVATSALSAG